HAQVPVQALVVQDRQLVLRCLVDESLPCPVVRVAASGRHRGLLVVRRHLRRRASSGRTLSPAGQHRRQDPAAKERPAVSIHSRACWGLHRYPRRPMRKLHVALPRCCRESNPSLFLEPPLHPERFKFPVTRYSGTAACLTHAPYGWCGTAPLRGTPPRQATEGAP